MENKKEYIERDKLLIVLEKLFHATDPCGEEQFGYLKAHRIVREAPSADVAPVVRCKDCRCFEERHYEDEGETPRIKTVCRLFKRQFYPDDYCSYGERKEV